MLKTLKRRLIILWTNSMMSKVVLVKTEMLGNILWYQMKTFTPAKKINVTRIKNIEVCLELEIESCTSATQGCEVFIQSETAPLETAPITEDLMRTEISKGARDFGAKDFVDLKEKGLVLAT